MASTLQLGRFSPREARMTDREKGSSDRLVFYRAVSVTAEDESSRTMLSHAAEALDAEAVELLLSRGADPNAQDRSELTPLLRVAAGPQGWDDDPETVEKTTAALLSGGASLLPRDSSGRNAAQRAASGLVYPFFIALEKAGKKPSGREEGTGNTLLHLVADAVKIFRELPGVEAVEREVDAVMIAKILVERLGFEKDPENALGRTPRMLAVRAGSRLLAPWLAHGQEIFAKTDRGSYLLLTGGATIHEAAAARNARAVAALIRLGLAPDEPAEIGSESEVVGLTPLSVAASVMATDVMDLLLENGADPTAPVNGKASGGRLTEGTSAMRMLLWAPSSPTRMPSGLTAQDWRQALTAMLRAPAAAAIGGPNYVANAPVDPEGSTPLLVLAKTLGRGWRAGEKDWASLAAGILLMQGADPNRAAPDGITPLAWAVRDGGSTAEDLIEMLLEAGAAVDKADARGVTPLMEAAALSDAAKAQVMLERLLDAGANPTIQDAEGHTALDFAAREGHAKVLGKLLDAVSAWVEAHPQAPDDDEGMSSPEPELLVSETVSEVTTEETAKMAPDTVPEDVPKSAVPAAPAAPAAPASSGFFARMRARAGVSEPASTSPQTEEASEPEPKPATNGTVAADVGGKAGQGFFARMRARNASSPVASSPQTVSTSATSTTPPSSPTTQELPEVPESADGCAATARTDDDDAKGESDPSAITPDEYHRRAAALAFFLKLVGPEDRSENERILLAQGLMSSVFGPKKPPMPGFGRKADDASESADPDDRLARKVADLLIDWGDAVELDWKTETDDFIAAVWSMKRTALLRDAGFESLPLDLADDEVPAYVRTFDAMAEMLGLPLRLASLAINADAYVLLLLPAGAVAPARGAAASAGLRLDDAKHMA